MRVVHKERAFEDERGQIIDLLENETIEHVTIIYSKKGAVRGNHYHKESAQYTYILKGSLKLFTQMPDGEIKTALVRPGDLVFNPPMEKHALVANEDSEFLVLTKGPRGGRNYEQDTYRLTESLESEPAQG